MSALVKDLYIDQGADWPGEAFGMVDALGNPKMLNPAMTGYGAIGGRGGPIFTWSNNPVDDSVGLIVFQGPLFIPQVSAAQNELWTFHNAPYQLYLIDPAAPVNDQETRVAQGIVYLSRKIG